MFQIKPDKIETENKTIRFPVPLLERIAELVEDDENGKDHSKKMKRWHILLLFGGEIKTKGTNKKLIRFINKMQKETYLFNKSKHTYINKI